MNARPGCLHVHISTLNTRSRSNQYLVSGCSEQGHKHQVETQCSDVIAIYILVRLNLRFKLSFTGTVEKGPIDREDNGDTTKKKAQTNQLLYFIYVNLDRGPVVHE